jgi:hypothetical protein
MAATDIRTGKFIRYCQDMELMTDVILIIDDVPYPAHRFMLAKYSTYFRDLFCRELPIEMRCRGVSAGALTAFLQLVYEGDCKITPATVKGLSKIAKVCEVEELRSKINEYVLSTSAEECLEVLKEESASFDDPLYESTFTSVVKDFKNIMRSPKFVELHLDTVCKILSSDILGVENETKVFEAAKAWIQHDRCQRNQHLSRVMECVRFALMDDNELYNIVYNDDLLLKSEHCRMLLLEASW